MDHERHNCPPARFDWLEGEALGPAVVHGFPRHLHIEHKDMIRAWLEKQS
jgi:hypothetical protein